MRTFIKTNSLEFTQNSPELKAFEGTLEWKDNIHNDGYVDDYHTFESVYYQGSSGKYFKVEKFSRGGTYSKHEYIARKAKSSKFVIEFVEVEPTEVTAIEWSEVEAQDNP